MLLHMSALFFHRIQPAAETRSFVHATTSDFMSSPGWPALLQQLNRLPAFTCAIPDGSPLEYELDGKPKGLFFTCVEAAKEEVRPCI